MKKAFYVYAAGFVVMILGGSALDSAVMILPAMTTLSGMAIMLLGLYLERR